MGDKPENFENEGVKVTFCKVEGGRGESHIYLNKGMKIIILQNRGEASDIL